MTTHADPSVAISIEKMEEELLALPRAIREHLAGVLTSSLRERELSKIWDEEADRRFRAYLAGELDAVPAEEGLAAIRARLRK